MTAVIDTIFCKPNLFNNRKQNVSQNKYQTNLVKEKGLNSLKFETQNSFSIIIKQLYCHYDLLLTITSSPFTILLKVHLITEKGNLLKIPQQQSKTYLIRKFLQSDDLYTPRINPETGAICFHLDYFNIKTGEKSLKQSDLRLMFKNLNLERLFLSIRKFVSFYESERQHKWVSDDLQMMKKRYQELSKTICLLNDSESIEDLTQYQCINEHQKHLNPQHQQRKELISDLDHFILGQKTKQDPINKRQISKEIKQINFSHVNIETLTKKKKGKSNYQTLLISQATQKQLKQQIIKMMESKAIRASIKISENDLGAITLILQKQDDPIYRAKMRFLNLLPRKIEYHFLDKYFKNIDNLPILISLSLKEESISRFLLTNNMCISMETKMRILLQICSAVHTMWQQKNVILGVANFKKIHITKNLTVKLRNISNFYKADIHMMLEQKTEVNIRLMQNWLNLSEIYFKLFFGYNIGHVRPAINSQTISKSIDRAKSVIMSPRSIGARLLPEAFHHPAKQILVGLNYIFLSFIDKASMMIRHSVRKRYLSRELYKDYSEDITQDTEETPRLLSYKLTCCWLFKNLQMITKQSL